MFCACFIANGFYREWALNALIFKKGLLFLNKIIVDINL